jgi:phenylpropionate dioxygenase-like ring-hydroxylating dioxygenase large terminal subunit
MDGNIGRPGEARCPGLSWDDMLAAEKRPVPEHLKAHAYEFLGSAPLDIARYVSPEFFRLEVERMWPRVWQFVCREEEIPEPGDVYVYDNVGVSLLVTRQPDGSIRAFHNSCLHRGRKLRTASGYSGEFKCPFHGFTWSTEGALKEIPCAWDFGHIERDKMRLPEARVDSWAGFVFANVDGQAPPLAEFLHPLPEHFVDWKLEDCVTAVWVAKVIPANWKATAEAFMEAWHSIVTHPQILPFTGDANTRYDIYGDHVNRAMTPFGTLSPHLAGKGHDEQFVVDSLMRFSGRLGGGAAQIPQVPPGMTAREFLGAATRARFAAETGWDFEHATDSELLDAYTYNLFPNFSPWGGYAPNIIYRWRPWPDQDNTLMEVRLLHRRPKDKPRPKPVRMKMLGPNDPWASAAEMGSLGNIYDQDMANLPFVQDGMKASRTGRIELGNYQEIRIRHFHRTLDRYLAQGPAA